MTTWRLVLLTLLALIIGGVGLYLVFQPAPDEPLDEVAMRTSAVMASSASTGMGILVPKLSLAAQVVAPQTGQGPVFVAVLRRTSTPTRRPTRAPTLQPTATATPPPTTPEPTVTIPPAPTIRPTDSVPPTAVPVTFTPAPTEPPRPSRTPQPTQPPPPTNPPNQPPATAVPPTDVPPPTAPPSGPGLAYAITGCGAITKPGGYYLTGTIGGNADCINIRSGNVTLDCKGNSIQGSGFNGDGIIVRKLGIIGSDRPKNVEIRNCTISGYHYAVFVEGSSGLYVHDNVFTHNYDDVNGQRYGIFLGMVEGGGIRLNESDGGRIDHNNSNNQAIGIDIRTSSGITVSNNDSSNNSAWGVSLVQTTNSEVSGNTTNNNVRYCTWGAGVVGPGCDAGGITLQDGSSGNRILNNEVGSGNGNGIFIKAHGVPCGNNNVIAGNNIHDVIYNSVELGFCTGNQVVGNNMHNSIDGIWMGFSTGNAIKDNTIANMNNHGIIVLNSFGNEVSGNQVINAWDGIYFFWEQETAGDFWWLDITKYTSHDNLIFNNTLTDNASSGIFLQDSTSNQIYGNTFTNDGKIIKMQGNTGGNQIHDNHNN